MRRTGFAAYSLCGVQSLRPDKLRSPTSCQLCRHQIELESERATSDKLPACRHQIELDPRVRKWNKDRQALSNAYMSSSTAKIITGVIVLALWSFKSPTRNLTASTTNQDQASLDAEERYGLSEAKRRQISEEIHSLWIQAGNIASNKYPIVVQGEQPRTTIEKMRDRARKRVAMVQSLTAEYLNVVARKYNLSQEQLTDIINEGIDKQWTNYPKPPPEYR